MWKNLSWFTAVLLLGFPYTGTASRVLQDASAPPSPPQPLSSSPFSPPSLNPAPLLWPDLYDFYHQPPPPPVSYIPLTAKTSFKISSLLLALPVGSVIILFICTYVYSRCRSDAGSASISASDDGSNPASTWQMHGDLPANSDTEGGRTDRSYIGKLPTLVFSAGKRMDDQEKVKRHSHGGEEMKKRVEHYNTCAVCLSEYEEDELLKRLPACSHLFHKECIDMWLFSHSTCPLCRLSLFNHKGDLILHNGKEATHLEHASTTSTPARPSSLLARCRSSYEQSSTLGLHNINISGNDDRIQRSTSHPVRRDNNNNNRVHPIG